MARTFESEQDMETFVSEYYRKTLPKDWLCAVQCVSADGIADIVLARVNPDTLLRRRRSKITPVLQYVSCSVLAALQSRGPLSLSELRGMTRYSTDYLRRKVLRGMIADSLVRREGPNYALTGLFSSPIDEIIAIELKLGNWRRAVYQASRYHRFADRSYVAMALEGSIRDRITEAVANTELGLMFVADGQVTTVLEASEQEPRSNTDRIFVSEQVLLKSLQAF